MTQPVTHGQSPEARSDDRGLPIAEHVRNAIEHKNFVYWLEGKSRFEVQGDKLVIYVPNPFTSNWLLKRFRTAFTRAAVAALGASATFEILVDRSLRSGDPRTQGPQSPATEALTHSLSSQTQKSDSEVQGAAPDPSAAPSQNSAARDAPTAGDSAGPASTGKNAGSLPGDVGRLAVRPSHKRRMRRFGTLITGSCNELAVMAAHQVADYPGERFNPLYVYGPTGVGKTHLLEAIYCDLRKNHPGLNVVLITSEAFTNYFTQALASKTVPSFRQKFRNVDVLMIDNVEFLDNKKATQEEFLHTIAQLIEQGGQLVISGDRHPRLLSRHREEVTTRLQSGMVCRIESPSEQTRRQVAASLALPYQEAFTAEALNYVARRCQRNIREIQGALNCLHGHYTLSKQKITVARAREILGELEQECRRLVRISDVEKVICDAFGLKAADLRSRSRRKAISQPRSLAMFVARKLTRTAYREIGMYFGGRDHSTVVAAEKRVNDWLHQDKPLDLPTSCRGQSVAEVLQELEERLMSLSA
ncbi:MAG: chromosomal replication initiator protein DnaA [Planctomycetaceae bacterium]|nr:chromosomal replication initiator protein DnaA [Planctomycetaceae bacterium]